MVPAAGERRSEFKVAGALETAAASTEEKNRLKEGCSRDGSTGSRITKLQLHSGHVIRNGRNKRRKTVIAKPALLANPFGLWPAADPARYLRPSQTPVNPRTTGIATNEIRSASYFDFRV